MPQLKASRVVKHRYSKLLNLDITKYKTKVKRIIKTRILQTTKHRYNNYKTCIYITNYRAYKQMTQNIFSRYSQKTEQNITDKKT